MYDLNGNRTMAGYNTGPANLLTHRRRVELFL